MFWFFCPEACGILAPQSGGWNHTPYFGRPSLTPWTIREVSICFHMAAIHHSDGLVFLLYQGWAIFLTMICTPCIISDLPFVFKSAPLKKTYKFIWKGNLTFTTINRKLACDKKEIIVNINTTYAKKECWIPPRYHCLQKGLGWRPAVSLFQRRRAAVREGLDFLLDVSVQRVEGELEGDSCLTWWLGVI